MNGFCPNCEKITPLELVKKEEEFKVHGESIMVEVDYYHCLDCGEDFDSSKSAIDPFEVAYREYRSRKGMLQPEEIREIRTRLGLTQKEFSDLIGIGIATVNRYENGALQSEAHDHAIRLVLEPRYLLKTLYAKSELIGDTKRRKLLNIFMKEAESSYLEITKDLFGSYNADLYSGFKPFELEKFVEAIKFFCYKDQLNKTKLVTLLFYADFAHFKRYSVSITGLKYTRLPNGPAPNQFEKFISALNIENEGIQKEEQWNGECSVELYGSHATLDASIFSTSELKVLTAVKEQLEKCTARQLFEMTNKEKGYTETENSELISYNYAEQLSIDV
jgi:putative zinc finger/helix-turn-helix YgiT family protein